VFFEGTLFKTIGDCLVVPTLVKGAEVLNHLEVPDLRRNRFGDVIQVVGLVFVEQAHTIKHSNRQTQVSLIDVLSFVAYQVKIFDGAGLFRLASGDKLMDSCRRVNKDEHDANNRYYRPHFGLVCGFARIVYAYPFTVKVKCDKLLH